jgi:hypothetical protein
MRSSCFGRYDSTAEMNAQCDDIPAGFAASEERAAGGPRAAAILNR